MNKSSKISRWTRRVVTAYVQRNEAHILTMMTASNPRPQGTSIDFKRLGRR